MPWKRPPFEIKLLQRAVSHPDAADLSGRVEALDATAQNRLWPKQRIRGKPLETFGEFAITPSTNIGSNGGPTTAAIGINIRSHSEYRRNNVRLVLKTADVCGQG